ncbi:HAAS signaling domain-containing protein [Homoserinibacter sp. YIM 151385]|uniref:HAAS signaling domain-containing protein n=1 Tax=Homoserinibacter sp. YIM 151385 TaxID=2985506 RepID=UPI0022EFE6BE|nr:hypothetical protein [Homoserinibacter sp. YIM 151385]WBU39238.1 hypothetical protein OF852_06585 [Homoserinibacter sp. YIM 151385]
MSAMPDTVHLPSEIAGFAAAVRSALSDLPREEVDELVDGLEADLLERADEGGADLGDPIVYAAELRAAAGLPPRVERARGPVAAGRRLRDRLAALVASDVETSSRLGRALRWSRDLLLSLRPVWWVLRGLVVGMIAVVLTSSWGDQPITFWKVVVVGTAVLVSVQLGRGRWMPFRWMRGALVAVSAAAAIALPFLAAGTISSINETTSAANAYYDVGMMEAQSIAMTNGGTEVSNIFAYDAQGKPLENVQLFDQDGNPLATNRYPDDLGYLWAPDNAILVPSEDVPGGDGWNVYPLQHVRESALADDGTLRPNARRQDAMLPFRMVRPLAGHEAEAAAEPMTADGVPKLEATPRPSPKG